MLQPFPELVNARLEQWRARLGQRFAGLVLALLAEVLLVLAVLSLGLTKQPERPPDAALVSITMRSDAEKKSPEKAQAKPATTTQRVQQQHSPNAAAIQPIAQPSAATPPPIIPVSRNQMAALDISKLPRQGAGPTAGRGPMGPHDHGVPGDSKRVGTAPGGGALYAASWYREPYDDELSGYLSTADGPGWALIACRTAPDFRVEDCVGLDEYPSGSQIQRAVLAAAWQFKVRPPRLGGVSKVGAWVRIRIDYTIRHN